MSQLAMRSIFGGNQQLGGGAAGSVRAREGPAAWHLPAGPVHASSHQSSADAASCSVRSNKGSVVVRRPVSQCRRGVTTRAFREWFSTWVHTTATPDAPALPETKATPRRDFLEARQVSLYQLFDGHEFKFDVPPYQRPYSWRSKQVYELLQDFLTAYDTKSEYFLGALVTTKTQEGVDAPLQVIDGQQRLTTLLVMLSFVHSWAREEGFTGLEQRMKRMLYIDADPLDPNSTGRFRLKLREGDDQFFLKNIVNEFLPIKYQLAGVAAMYGEERDDGDETSSSRRGRSADRDRERSRSSSFDASSSYTSASSSAGFGLPEQPNLEGIMPLENETWWRIYENASFLRDKLRQEMEEGLNLQEFMFHVLRNCYVVVMHARDEAASFRIFSTLNGRGMDLSMVDKLKADLLEVVEPGRRRIFSEAWSEMEDVLGRTTFHHVFDHMKALAECVDPKVAGQTVLEYFVAKRNAPGAVPSIINVALAYGKILLQLRQCRWEISPPPRRPGSVTHGLLREDISGAIITHVDSGGPESPNTTHGAVRALERQSRHMNLFRDDTWLPATLEFFLQVEDVEQRTRFLQGAEVLQLYLELCGDEAMRRARWGQVARTLLLRSASAHFDPTEVFEELALTKEERRRFRTRLDQKDLQAAIPKRTLAHLLIRAEGTAVSASPEVNLHELHVVRMVPVNPPERSMWRRNKLWILPNTNTTVGTNTSASASNWADLQLLGTGSSGSDSNWAPGEEDASTSYSYNSTASFTTNGRQKRSSPPHASTSGYSFADKWGSPSKRSSPAGSPEGDGPGFKYWYEVQRVFWCSKLGNLILAPVSSASWAQAKFADYDDKAAFLKQAGVEAQFPEFSGSVVSGRFARYKFSFEECKARHQELLARLSEIFHLEDADDEEPWWMIDDDDDDYWPEDSVY